MTSAGTAVRALGTTHILGRHELRNRVCFAPTSVGYAEEGILTRKSLDHYARRARGGVAVVMTEQLAVSLSGWQHRRQPGAWLPEHVPGLTELASRVHAAGAVAIAQLSHTGRYAGPWEDYDARRRLAPSAVPFDLPTGRVTPAEITLPEIAEVIEDFAAATRLVLDCGFDGIEVHGGSGFLLASFLSPRMNLRHDEYGGDRARRARFPLEVVAACRGAAGSDPVIGYHLMTDELMSGGQPLADALALVPQLEAAGVDFFRPAGGTFEAFRAPHNTGRSAGTAFDLVHTLDVARVATVSVMAGGGIRRPHEADRILDEAVDLIALSRPLLADPEWVHKALAGEQPTSCACATALCLRTQLTGTVCEAWSTTNPEHDPAPLTTGTRSLQRGTP